MDDFIISWLFLCRTAEGRGVAICFYPFGEYWIFISIKAYGQWEGMYRLGSSRRQWHGDEQRICMRLFSGLVTLQSILKEID